MPKNTVSRYQTHKAGFSLVEMSVVVAIIAVIAVFGLQGVALFFDYKARSETVDRMEEIQISLRQFYISKGFFPKPAPLNGTAAQVNAATFAQAASDCTDSGIIRQGGVCIGAVPLSQLRLPLHIMADAWNQRIVYVVTEDLTDTPAAFEANPGRIRIRSGEIGSPPNVITNEGAFMLISHGPNMVGGYNLRSATRTLSCTAPGPGDPIDQANCDNADNIFYEEEFNRGSNNAWFFDDLVLWENKPDEFSYR